MTSLIFAEYQNVWWNKAILVQMFWVVQGPIILIAVFNVRKLVPFFAFLQNNSWADIGFQIVFLAYFTYPTLIFLLNILTPSRLGVIFARYFNGVFTVAIIVLLIIGFYT